jgi:hypothetical protein
VHALETGGDNAGFAYAHHRQIDANDRLLRDGPSYRAQGMAFHRHLLFNFVGNGSSAVFRRRALLEAGCYDRCCTDWGGAEDYLLQLRIAARHPVICVPRWLVGYRRARGTFSSNELKAYSARLKAVDAMLSEVQTPLGLRIRRWVSGDAQRALSVQLATRGSAGAAIGWGLRAAIRDPAGTAAEGAARARNAMARAGQRKAAGAVFAEHDPDLGSPPGLDRMLRRRLAQLAIADAAMPPDRAQAGGKAMIAAFGEALR